MAVPPVIRAAQEVLAASGRSYSRHGGRMLAGAVAFSALLSIAPLLFIALHVSSYTVGDDVARASVFHDLAGWIGADGARTIFALLQRANAEEHGGVASVIGGVVLVYASTRLFSQMKRALNHMWDVHARSGKGWRGKVWKQARKRGLALLMVVFVGFVIVFVVVVKVVLVAATVPIGGDVQRAIIRFVEALLTLATTTVMFGALFKFLPDARLTWRDAWQGALVTALLFSIGTTVISLYLGHKTLDVLYGPGGSLVMVLLWVHYSAQVFFFGAAVTGELAKRRGHPIEPDDHGVRIVIDTGQIG